MAVAYTAKERDRVEREGACPARAYPETSGSFHPARPRPRSRRRRPTSIFALALDPTPVVTKASEFQGLLNAAIAHGRDARASAPAMSSRCSRRVLPCKLRNPLLGGDVLGFESSR